MSSCLQNLDPSKAVGPDHIPARPQSRCNRNNSIFNAALQSLLEAWHDASTEETSQHHPMLKRGDPHWIENYRPISPLCFVSKVLDKYVYNYCYNSISERWTANTTWIQFILIFAFDKLPHQLLLHKLQKYVFCGPVHQWFTSLRDQPSV